MSELSGRKFFLSAIIVSALGLTTAAGFATQCGQGNTDPPTVTPITNGREIECPSDAADSARVYAALMLYRQDTQEEFPLYEGCTYDPFDGTIVDFTYDDGYLDGDQFFMRAVCSAQFDSPMRSLLGVNSSTHTPVPGSVQTAMHALKRAYRSDIPRPRFVRYQEGTPDKVIVHLPSWTPPAVDLGTVAPGVTVVEMRAALKRKALGFHDSDPTETPGTPESIGNALSDSVDNGMFIASIKQNGKTLQRKLKLQQRNVLLYNDLSGVFGNNGKDSVIRGRRYKYYTEIFYTLEYQGKRYYGGIRGKKRLRLRIPTYGTIVGETPYEPIPDPDDNN
jgi:hypothetical protein